MTGAARLRPFVATDYPAWVAASNRCYPDYPWTVEEARHQDGAFDERAYFRMRVVAEVDGALVGSVQVHHKPGRYHPDRYAFDLWVLPGHRRRGYGGALYEVALAKLVERDAIAATAGAKESMADGVDFLRARGWVEIRRDWESRLPLRDFDPAPFAAAEERVRAQGIRISTLADELGRDPDAERKAFELVETCRQDVPDVDAATPSTIEDFRLHWTGAPGFLPDAFYVAIGPDGRWLGLSNMTRSLDDPSFIWQGLTGVRREERGRGIAMALKLRTVAHARRLGVEHIKTWNAQTNRPMLAVNEALGFVKQPAWIAFELRLRS